MPSDNQIYVDAVLNSGAALYSTVHGNLEINDGASNCGTVIGNIHVRKGGNHGKSCPSSTLCTGRVTVDSEGELHGAVLGDVTINSGAIVGSPNYPAIVTGNVIVRNEAIVNNLTVYGDARVQRLADTSKANLLGNVSEYKVGPYINAYYGDNGDVAPTTTVKLPTPALDGPANVYYNYEAGTSNPANGYYSTGRYLNGGITIVPVATPRPAIDDGKFRVYNVSGPTNTPTTTPIVSLAGGVYSNGHFQAGEFYYPAFGTAKPTIPLDSPPGIVRTVYFQGASPVFDAHTGISTGQWAGGSTQWESAAGASAGSGSFAGGTDTWSGDIGGWAGYSVHGWAAGPYSTGFFTNGFAGAPPIGTPVLTAIDGKYWQGETTLTGMRYSFDGGPAVEYSKGYIGSPTNAGTATQAEIWINHNNQLGQGTQIYSAPTLLVPVTINVAVDNVVYIPDDTGLIVDTAPLPTGYTSSTPITGMGSFPNSTQPGATTILV